MTQTPPVSPDFAAMAREHLKAIGAGPTWINELTALLTLSHAAGRAEGLTEAAGLRRALEEISVLSLIQGKGFAFALDVAKHIARRALASDPGDPSPAPAPGDHLL